MDTGAAERNQRPLDPGECIVARLAVGTTGADEGDPGGRRLAHQEVEQLEGGRIRPLQVLECREERRLAGQLLQELREVPAGSGSRANRGTPLAGRSRSAATRARERGPSAHRARPASLQRARRRSAPRRSEGAHRPRARTEDRLRRRWPDRSRTPSPGVRLPRGQPPRAVSSRSRTRPRTAACGRARRRSRPGPRSTRPARSSDLRAEALESSAPKQPSRSRAGGKWPGSCGTNRL